MGRRLHKQADDALQFVYTISHIAGRNTMLKDVA
jgi:hypothetical protein